MTNAISLLTTLLFCSLSLRAQKPELVLPALHAAAISELSFSADGKYLASCAGKEIKLWEVASGRLLRTILAPDPINHIALSKDGARLVSGSYCGADVYDDAVPELNTDVRVWDMVTGKPIRTLKSFGKPVCLLDVGISPDMKYAFAYFEGGKTNLAGKISIWDINTGKEQATIPNGADAAYESVSFSADSKHLLLMAPDTVNHAWGVYGIPQWADWATGKIENIFEESCRTVCSAGDEVIACTVSGIVKRWNTLDKTRSTDQKLNIALGEDDKIVYDGFVFSNDGTRLCILSTVSKESGGLSYDYNRFRIFDTQSGALVSDRTCAEEGGYKFNWAFPPNIGLYVAYPRPPEFAMIDALLTGMKAYSTATGAFSHPFGMTSLEKTIVANASLKELYCQVFDKGKLFSIRRDTFRITGLDIYNYTT